MTVCATTRCGMNIAVVGGACAAATGASGLIARLIELNDADSAFMGAVGTLGTPVGSVGGPASNFLAASFSWANAASATFFFCFSAAAAGDRVLFLLFFLGGSVQFLLLLTGIGFGLLVRSLWRKLCWQRRASFTSAGATAPASSARGCSIVFSPVLGPIPAEDSAAAACGATPLPD